MSEILTMYTITHLLVVSDILTMYTITHLLVVSDILTMYTIAHLLVVSDILTMYTIAHLLVVSDILTMYAIAHLLVMSDILTMYTIAHLLIVAGLACDKLSTSKSNLIPSANAILSPLDKQSTLESSNTVFRFSTHIVSTGPSNTSLHKQRIYGVFTCKTLPS